MTLVKLAQDNMKALSQVKGKEDGKKPRKESKLDGQEEEKGLKEGGALSIRPYSALSQDVPNWQMV